MNISVFGDLLAALDMAAFERIEPMVFRAFGTPPAWSGSFLQTTSGKTHTFRCKGTSPYLETFLSEAEQHWAASRGGRLESEVWTEDSTSGDHLCLRASAVTLGEKKFLVIERVEAEFREKQKMLQKSLERRLDYERLIKTQEALRQSERKYHHLVDNLLEGIWHEDDKGYAVFVNPRFIELCGCSSEDEILGRHWSECLPEEEVDRVRREMDKRMAGRRSTYETVLKRRDGGLCPVLVSTNPLFEGERYVGSISAFTDISERRELEERLKDMARDLERQVEERTRELLRAQQHLAQSQK